MRADGRCAGCVVACTPEVQSALPLWLLELVMTC